MRDFDCQLHAAPHTNVPWHAGDDACATCGRAEFGCPEWRACRGVGDRRVLCPVCLSIPMALLARKCSCECWAHCNIAHKDRKLSSSHTVDADVLSCQCRFDVHVLACRVLPKGRVPHTRFVRGSNFNLINVFEDRIPGRAIVLSVIDNVCKGASGQAIQNLNVMMGCDERTAIDVMPVFP